jgi:hypothetical protein
VTLAVSSEGRRRADAPMAGDALDAGTLAVLDHAGPRASSWLSERALGPSAAPDVVTGRAPLALDDAGWARIVADFARAAEACRVAGVPFVLGAHDDGLLHSALSPRTGALPSVEPAASDAGIDRVLEIHRAVGGGDVILVVEDLCPRGLDATDGIAIARAFVGQGARRIYAAAGTDALPPLRRRVKGTHESDPRHAARAALASAAWLVGRVDAEVVAVVPRGAPDLLADAVALGLAGVVVEEDA